MPTIEKIVHRLDGRIGVWTGPKVEIEFNDLDHLRNWISAEPRSLDDAALRQLLAASIKDANVTSDVATTKPVTVDVLKAVDDAVKAEVAIPVDPVAEVK